jgi:cell division septum initiation protein DivIVA
MIIETEAEANLRAARIVDLADADARRLRDEAARITDSALAHAEQLRAEAEADAQAIRDKALQEGARIVEDARVQAYFEASHIREEGARQARATMLRVPPTTAPIHSSEISLREFPRSVRGVDPEAVSKWLALVEQSYALVEDELERRRRDLDDLLAALGDMRRHLGRAHASGGEEVDDAMGRARDAWNRAVEVACASVPSTRLGFDTLVVRTALMETPLRRQLLGYSRDQVRRLLEASTAQLARLENQLHLTHAENERLRSVFLEQLPPLDG